MAFGLRFARFAGAPCRYIAGLAAQARRATRAPPRRTTGCYSARCCCGAGPWRLGATSLSPSASGTACSSPPVARLSLGFSSAPSTRSRRRSTMSGCMSTAPLFRRTRRRGLKKGDTRPGNRAFDAGWLLADAAARGGDPGEAEPTGAARVRPLHLRLASPGRELLRENRGVPAGGDALRQNPRELCGGHLAGRGRDRGKMIVNRPKQILVISTIRVGHPANSRQSTIS